MIAEASGAGKSAPLQLSRPPASTPSVRDRAALCFCKISMWHWAHALGEHELTDDARGPTAVQSICDGGHLRPSTDSPVADHGRPDHVETTACILRVLRDVLKIYRHLCAWLTWLAVLLLSPKTEIPKGKPSWNGGGTLLRSKTIA